MHCIRLFVKNSQTVSSSFFPPLLPDKISDARDLRMLNQSRLFFVFVFFFLFPMEVGGRKAVSYATYFFSLYFISQHTSDHSSQKIILITQLLVHLTPHVEWSQALESSFWRWKYVEEKITAAPPAWTFCNRAGSYEGLASQCRPSTTWLWSIEKLYPHRPCPSSKALI